LVVVRTFCCSALSWTAFSWERYISIFSGSPMPPAQSNFAMTPTTGVATRVSGLVTFRSALRASAMPRPANAVT
jgi:hypothetical protein